MAMPIIIIISTGSEERYIDPEVTLSHLILALKGRSLSGTTEIIINYDGSVEIEWETIYTPKQPKMAEPTKKKRS